jgi:cell division protein FtsQ
MTMKKKKDKELSPWAKYQKEHPYSNSEEAKRSSSKTGSRVKRKNTKTLPKKTVKPKINIDLQITRKTKVIISSITVLVILVLVYVLTPISRIQNIKVVGNKRVETSKIIKSLSIKKNGLILMDRFEESANEKQIIKKHPDVKNANISISITGQVKVEIKENAVMGYAIRNKTYYTVKQDGTVAKKSQTQPSGKYPIFRSFKNDAILKDFLKKYATLPNEVQNDISEVDFTPTKHVKDRIHFFMNDENHVYAIISTFAKKMKYYSEISASMKKPGMIDLQVGAFSRPNGWVDEYKSSKDAATEESQTTSSSKSSDSSSKATTSSSSQATNVTNNGTQTQLSNSSSSTENANATSTSSAINTAQNLQ